MDVIYNNRRPKFLQEGGVRYRIRPLPPPRLRDILTEYAEWVTIKTKPDGSTEEVVPKHPPAYIVSEILARPNWDGVRVLEAVTDSPVLLADGSILDRPGYHESSGVLLLPSIQFERVTPAPTRGDALEAVAALKEIVVDVPFKSDSHRSAYLAALLTTFARLAIDEPVPLFLSDSNTRGSGKGLILDTISVIKTGEPMARTAYPSDDIETHKLITTIAVEGEPIVMFDNLEGAFGCPSLDAATTSKLWKGRILGKTESSGKVPLRTIFFATGNNVQIAGDLSRRILHIRLESPEERPEERSDFRHADLLEWVKQERPRLVRAVLTILRAYHVAGRPDMRLKPWGSYPKWSALVRSALVWADESDPGLTRIELAEQNDTESHTLDALLEGLVHAGVDATHGITARQMIERSANGDDLAGLREAIGQLCPTRDGKSPTPQALGKKLQHLRRRVIAGRCLDRKPENTAAGAIWIVISADALR